MKKNILLVAVFATLLQCTYYKPIIDTAGRSGTFNESKSEDITNDLQHCQYLAKDNTNMIIDSGRYVLNYYIRPSTVWLAPKAKYEYPDIYKRCMTNRGHAVIK